MTATNSLSKTLQFLMIEQGIKPIALAESIKVPLSTINRIINGKTTVPQGSTIEKLASYFKVSTSFLLNTKAAFNKCSMLDWDKAYEAVTAKSIEQFCLTMPDASMQPIFDKGSCLIFDTAKVPKNRDYVLVYDGTMCIFCQLIEISSVHIFKILNPENTTTDGLLEDGGQYKILAVLIESRQTF